MISPIMTPLRIYDDIYESDRFSSDCDIERFELISDKTRALPFQFRREKSPALIGQWFLRKECEDPYRDLLNTNDSFFTLNTGFWTRLKYNFVNGKLQATGGGSPSSLQKAGIFTIGKQYTIKIVINEFNKAVGSTFDVTYDIAGSGVIPITGTGTITIVMVATTTDFTIDGVGGTGSDSITIESIQISEIQSFDTSIGDIDLPLDQIILANINDDEDIIQYCGTAFPFQIPACKYYIIIATDDGLVYYSELITFKDFIPSQSPYTLIEWYNDCDIAGIIYQEIQDCSYRNRMYIQGELSKPEHPFKEEGQEDGEFNVNILFQKWEKTSNLVVAKCPEFITDALTGMRLHDTVNITKSIRKKQLQVLRPFEVDKVEYEPLSVFNECATNINLKILLKDRVVDAACCSNEVLSACYGCDYEVTALDELSGVHYFGGYEGDFGLFHVSPEMVYTDLTPTTEGKVVCVGDTGLKYINLNGEYWQVVPAINDVNDTDLGGGLHSYEVIGYIYPGSYCKIHAVVYDSDTSVTTTINYPTIYEPDQIAAGVDILSSTFGVAVPSTGYVKFYIECFSLNCTYGNSEDYFVEYSNLHPIVQTWYDDLSGDKLSPGKLYPLNSFIKGLDDDGTIAEFDFLHVLAGMETDEQRLKPLITTSGLDMIVGGVGGTLDGSGFENDGASYINTKWRPLSNGSKYAVNNASAGVYINSLQLADTICDIGYVDTVKLYLNAKDASGDTEGAISQSSVISGSTVVDTGMFSIVNAGTGTEIFIEDTSVQTGSNLIPVIEDLEIYLGARNEFGSDSWHTSRQYQFVYLGSKDVNLADLSARFATLKTTNSF